jgi:hypothetical protein
MRFKKTLYHCALPMLVSLFIYLLFRPQNVIVNRFIPLSLPVSSSLFRFHPYDPLVYNLPGALWLYSFLSSFRNLNFGFFKYSLIPLFVALTIELLQGLHITDGTFDWFDVLFYIAAWLFFIVLQLTKAQHNSSLQPSSRITKSDLAVFLFFIAVVILSDVWV